VAMGKFNFSIVDQFAIKIAHALMISPNSKFAEIDTIMTHPQVLAQCKNNLMQKFPHLKLTSGEGEMVDHALVAKSISEGKLPLNVATMGSKVLASIYNLKIVEDNLQDLQKNFTTFLVVSMEIN